MKKLLLLIITATTMIATSTHLVSMERYSKNPKQQRSKSITTRGRLLKKIQERNVLTRSKVLKKLKDRLLSLKRVEQSLQNPVFFAGNMGVLVNLRRKLTPAEISTCERLRIKINKLIAQHNEMHPENPLPYLSL